jgi:hypothetical protein
MAKLNETPAEDQSPMASLLLTFRDKLYTSRTLITPQTGRTLPVAKGLVDVLPSDTEALTFLKANAEFEPLE